MSEQKVENGDLVLITDGSYAVRVDSFEEYTSIGLCNDVFEVVRLDVVSDLRCWDESIAHDIYIRNTISGEIYLHSSALVRKVENESKCCRAGCNK